VVDAVGWHGPPEQVPPDDVAAKALHGVELELELGLDPLGDDLETEIVGQAYDGLHNRGVSVLGYVLDEAAVHFELVHREAPQIRQ
jgi:hypothetical protein